MTITNTSTRLAALVAGVAVALALMGAVAVAPAQAAGLTSTQVQAIVSLLASFGADQATINNVTAALNGQATTGTGSGSTGGTCPALVRSLQLGSSGADVMALQKFLNANAATRVSVSGAGSPGLETTYFGPATQAAVIKFQAANNVSAIGVVGPATRAAIAAVCSNAGGNGTGTGTGTGTGSVVLQGGEGQLDINGTLGDIENSVDEGSTEQVVGAEVEAKDSDVMIERVDVDFTLSGTGSTRLTNYIDSASVWLDGKKLAALDASDITKDTGNVYSFRFSGLKGVVREGDTANLYVKVDAVSNIDSQDETKDIQVEIPVDGIRAVDAAGISDTYVASGDNITETFNVQQASSGDVNVTEGDNNPDSMTVQIDTENDTTDILALAFDVKAKNSDINVDAIPVGFTTSGAANGIMKRAVLKMDGKVVDTKTITGTGSSTSVVFDDLNLDINKDDTANFEVFIDVNDQQDGSFNNGATVYAVASSTDNRWDIEDANGDAVTPSGSVTNSPDGVLTFRTAGLDVAGGSTSGAVITNVDATSTDDQGKYVVEFNVTAFDQDAYIALSAARSTSTVPATVAAGVGYHVEDSSNTAVYSAGTVVSSLERVSGGTETGGYVRINEGQTAKLRLTVYYDPATTGIYRVQADSVNFNTTNATANTQQVLTPDADYTSPSVQVQN